MWPLGAAWAASPHEVTEFSIRPTLGRSTSELGLCNILNSALSWDLLDGILPIFSVDCKLSADNAALSETTETS